MTRMKRIFTDKEERRICVNPFNLCYLRTIQRVLREKILRLNMSYFSQAHIP